MWRALFLAIGFCICILGVESLAVQKYVLRAREKVKVEDSLQPELGRHKEIVPPNWAPFSMIGLGSIVVIYSFTLPQRIKGG